MVPKALAKMMDQPLSEEELKDTICAMKKGKSPGIDGLPNEFFMEYLLTCWQEALQLGSLPSSMNTGVIKLIHKKGVKGDLLNWRPVTCLTFAYKVFAITLAKIPSPIMKTIILPEQKGFFKRRYILDAIITLRRTFEYAEEPEQ
ncbi:hypothetical protein L7F22_057309 [Adiantum nelumboides]|nr:hypothetical protein [Adiantum nelumboides]